MESIIIIAVCSVTAIGAVCAAILCIVSKVMYVKEDPRLEKILECLPGASCGACGFPGCSGYAKALLYDPNVKTNFCTPGGETVLKNLSKILGVEAGEFERIAAIVHCRGGRETHRRKIDYAGIESCEAAKQLFGGEGACAFGCIGYGDCKAVCPNNAICMVDGLARINVKNCTGCGLCVRICPNNLISLENINTPVFVLCKNTEKGAIVRKKCTSACLGCGKCARECPVQNIVIENNLAKIYYETCTGCNRCAEVCVTGCIQKAYRTGK